MRIIGITGGIGSGKSTASAVLQRLGARVIDADKIAREVVSECGMVQEELVGYFGQGILDETGKLDRKKVANVVFNNSEKLNVLNNITHKYVIERIFNELDKARKETSSGLIVLDVPIPVRHGFLDTVDEVWVITAQRDTRISRIMERSGLIREEAISRINSQMSDEEFMKIADKVIQNDDGLEELEAEIKKAL